MQLKRLHHYFRQFKNFLGSPKANDRLHIWESQKIFRENWNLEEPNLATMYDASLQNSTTRRLWKREQFEPKRMMLLFAELQPDMVRHMFRDLFEEKKSIEGRVDRFVYYCDELLDDYKKSHPRSVENNHYHGNDYEMIALYLAFRYPDQYAPYRFPGFRQMLEYLGAADIPRVHDIERFFRVMRTLYKLLQKEEEIMVSHRRRLDEKKHYLGESLLLVYDFYQWMTQPGYEVEHFAG